MKYVTFTISYNNPPHEETFVVLFNEDSIPHANVAYGMQHAARGSLARINGAVCLGASATPRSAGFFGLNGDGKVFVHSRSDSLNLGPLPGDDELIAKQLRGRV